MNRRYLLVVLVVCLLVGSVQAWGADFGAWKYRKEITVNNTGSNLTNYQVLFTVNRSAGSDSGFTTYLDGKCESDYDDIRFTTGENTPCDYWIESNSSTVASIWVEVPSIVNSTAYGSTTMYLYYHNSNASAVSNGTNTFDFFDDFLGGSLDAGKWTTSGGTLNVSNSIMAISGGTVNSNSAFSDQVIFRSRVKPKYVGAGYTIYQRLYDAGSRRIICTYADAGSFPSMYRVYDTAQSTSNILGHAADTWHIQEVWWIASNSVKFYVNDANYVAITSNVPTVDLNLNYAAYTGDADISVDWIFTRKYAAIVPTVTRWGVEEDSTPRYITVDFSGVPTSGYVPLTVYFTDATVGYNVTLDTWAWSFGDTTPNSTSQNPAHTYTTSGLYTVGLTATNTSFAKTNTTTKVAYINATVNLDAPNADFTVTETCGDIGDTFYFIDFSTGGGLYAWNWSFGDGQYSELRNPTHQYSSNGTFDVGLTVWGAYGNDTLTRSNLITIPCGAPTPTPTPTATPTGNVTPTPTGTPPVQGPAQPGRISPLGFVLLAGMDFALIFYAWIDNANRNYFHIVACIAAVVLSFLCGTFLVTGYVTEDFVVTNADVSVNESVLSTYQVHQAQIIDYGVGYFFLFIGVMMLIIGILAGIEAVREMSEGAEFE